MTDNDTVRVGIAGLGRSGWDIHVRLLQTLPEKYRIVAVSDTHPDRCQEAADTLRCRALPTFEGLANDPEAELVVVATPSHLHAAQTLQALRAGKHVVCEKPMARHLREADEMIAAATEAGRILTIFQNHRYAKDFQQVLRVIQSGVLGRIIHIRMAGHGFGRRWDWQTLQQYGGGTLCNVGSHYLDQALVLLGDRDPKVFCLRDRALTLGDADDHVKVLLYGEGAPTVEVELTAACPYPQERWLIMGTRGGLSGNAHTLRWKFFDPAHVPARALSEEPTPDRSYNADELARFCTEKTWTSKDDRSPGEKGFYLDLYDTLRKGAPLVIKPEQVRRQIWVLDRCREMAPLDHRRGPYA